MLAWALVCGLAASANAQTDAPVMRGWLPPTDGTVSVSPPDFPFVRTRGAQLVAGNSEALYAIGANMWHAAWLGAPAGPTANRTRLLNDLDALQRAGVTTVRLVATSEGPDTEPWRVTPSTQPCPGHYDVNILDGLDYALYSLGKRRMRATLVLGNEWPWTGGMAQYLRWAEANYSYPAANCTSVLSGEPDMRDSSWLQHGWQNLSYPGPGHPAPGGGWGEWQQLVGGFYDSSAAQELWRAHVTFLLSRRSRYTGVSVGDDPTVAFLELANEPRPANASASPQFNQWLAASAQLLKKLAPRTLITSGMEGDTSHVNLGQATLLSQASVAGLDVLTVHLWPMNFNWLDPGPIPGGTPGDAASARAKTGAYIDVHAAYAASLGKPLLLEEFGWPRDGGSLSPDSGTSERDKFFDLVMRRLVASARAGGALAAASFWGYSGSGRPDARYAAVPPTLPDAASASDTPQVSLYGSPVDWASCFRSESARPMACPLWAWWTPAASWRGEARGQSTLLNDPPHEAQGWYSVYDGDASTLAVIGRASAALRAALGCAASAFSSLHAAQKDPSLAASEAFGAAACTATAGNLLEPEGGDGEAAAACAAADAPAVAPLAAVRG